MTKFAQVGDFCPDETCADYGKRQSDQQHNIVRYGKKGEMMAVQCWFQADLRNHITAAVVPAIETANAHGPINGDFVAGVLTMAKHRALAVGVTWADVVSDIRIASGVMLIEEEHETV